MKEISSLELRGLEEKNFFYRIRPFRAAFEDKNACKWKTNGLGDVVKSNS